VPNQPRPQTNVGTPQPMSSLPPATAPPPAPISAAGMEAEAQKAHEASVARMLAARPTMGVQVGGRDALSRPYKLPSGGLWYPQGHGGNVFISPTRGEQEEVLAGMGEGAAASAALRNIAEQVVDFNGIGLGDILVLDWPAILLNMLAYAAGDDRVFMAPTCLKPRGCGKASDQTRSLIDMECVELHLAASDADATWPVAEPEDPDMAILAEIMGKTALGTVKAFVSPDGVEEPFYTEPLKAFDGRNYPGAGTRIGWRHLRMRDLEIAEEFSQRTGSTQVKAGSKLNNVLLALQIVLLDGNAVEMPQAYSWVKRTPSPILADLRRQLERRSFGYNMRPRFRCPHCGHSFRADLPLDGSLFRGGGA